MNTVPAGQLESNDLMLSKNKRGGPSVSMHITLHLTSDTQDRISLPRANLHLFQSLLYKIMPNDTASFLHDDGYSSGDKKLKLFAMSWPRSAERPELLPDEIVFRLPIRLTVSTPVQETMNALVYGAVTADHLRVGRNYLKCRRAEVAQHRAAGSNITVETLSPVTCYRNIMCGPSRYTEYFSPDMQEFEDFIYNNLRTKFCALHPGSDIPDGYVNVTPMGDIYERAAMHSQKARVPIKGWSGRFQLDGPQELLQTALDCGLGAKNSGGWGCIVPV